jgi:hypothetical protein
VRLGHFKGSRDGAQAFERALALLMKAVPASRTSSDAVRGAR